MRETVISLEQFPEWNALIAEKCGWTVKRADGIRHVFLWPGDRYHYVTIGEPYVVHGTGAELTVPRYFSHTKAAQDAEHHAMEEGWTIATSRTENGRYRVEYSRLDMVDTEFVFIDRNRATASMMAFCKALGVEVAR